MQVQHIVANTLLSLCLLWLSFVVMWIVLSGQNFHYPFWYKQLSIQENIQRFAPLNEKGKRRFALTSPSQHADIFSQVIDSVNNAGEGLTSIQFQVTGEDKAYDMFTPAEITHLQDVANLLTLMKHVSLFILFGFILLVVFLLVKPIPIANIRYHLGYGTGLIAVLTCCVLLLGPKYVFYWLHIQVFPSEHQWFFLYRESLMSTFMKAPALFAPMAATWLLSSVLLWLAFLMGMLAMLKRFGNHTYNNRN